MWRAPRTIAQAMSMAGPLSDILDLIREYESKAAGEYNATGGRSLNGTRTLLSALGLPLPTKMTVGDILKNQRRWYNRAANTTAVGAYQIIQSTFKLATSGMNVPLDLPFEPQVQDGYAVWLLLSKVKSIRPYLNRPSPATLDSALKGLAAEWASFPVDAGGATFTGGAGGVNPARVSATRYTRARKAFQIAAGQPVDRPMTAVASATPRDTFSGQDVRKLQGFLIYRGASIAVDGLWGPQTQRAWERFGGGKGPAVVLAQSETAFA